MRPSTFEYDLAFSALIDEQPIRLDVALMSSLEIADEFVITV
jgi:hypothetical protein